jgi:hypothetical protein
MAHKISISIDFAALTPVQLQLLHKSILDKTEHDLFDVILTKRPPTARTNGPDQILISFRLRGSLKDTAAA